MFWLFVRHIKHQISVLINPYLFLDCHEAKKVKPESMQVVPNLSNISSNSSSYTESRNDSKTLQTFLPHVLDKKSQSVDEYRVSSHRLTSDSSMGSDCTLLDRSTGSPKQTQVTQCGETTDSVLTDWRKPGHETEYFYGSYLDYLKKKHSSQNNIASPSVPGYVPCHDGDSTDAGLGYSLADMTDCSKPRIVENTVIAEEDAASVSSTTSGTYVVDPQALCKEIDALFFKDSSRA